MTGETQRAGDEPARCCKPSPHHVRLEDTEQHTSDRTEGVMSTAWRWDTPARRGRWPFYFFHHTCQTCQQRKPLFTAVCDACWERSGQ